MKKILIKIIILIFVFTGIFVLSKGYAKNENPVKIAFFGDSITELGWKNTNGYVRQTVTGLQKKGKNLIVIPAGICGNTTKDLLERMDNDIIAKHPDILLIMCGINDTGRLEGGASQYKLNMNKIIEKALKNNIKVVLLTITTTEKNYFQINNITTDYNLALFELAKNNHIQLIDINSAFKKALKKSGKNPEEDHIFTTDGVHLNEMGDTILANTIIEKIKF